MRPVPRTTYHTLTIQSTIHKPVLNRDDSPDSHLTASATASWTATVSSLLYDALLRVVRKVAEVAATAASVHGDFGDDSATAPTLARAAAWRRENPARAC